MTWLTAWALTITLGPIAWLFMGYLARDIKRINDEYRRRK